MYLPPCRKVMRPVTHLGAPPEASHSTWMWLEIHVSTGKMLGGYRRVASVILQQDLGDGDRLVARGAQVADDGRQRTGLL